MDKFVIKSRERYLELSRYLFNNPELGFSEFKTKDRVIKELKLINPNISITESNMTGFKTSLGSGEYNVGVVAELDAVYAPSHFNCDRITGAAHNCGHFAQVVIAVMMYEYLFNNPDLMSVEYTFIFTPAEEYLDLDYRKELLKENKIAALSGKIDMILTDFVSEIDLFFSIHSMVDDSHDFDLGTDLTAFSFLTIELEGKAAHAGVEPEKGINALDYAVEVYQYLRGLEREYTNNHVRINPIITCDEVLNVVVENAKIETYIRVSNNSYAKEFITKTKDFIERMQIIKSKVTVTEGYLELQQDCDLVEISANTLCDYRVNRTGLIFAGGDIGDFSYLAPTIQIGFGGFDGQIHGSEFKISTDDVYQKNFSPLMQCLLDISSNVGNLKLYRRSKDDYKEYKYGGINV